MSAAGHGPPKAAAHRLAGLTSGRRTKWLVRAAWLIMLAVLATQRKTGIIAPLAGVATLAYFRRRELLKLAPPGVALLAVLVIVSPGTVQPVLDQFQPDRLGANPESDRASDYDAAWDAYQRAVALAPDLGDDVYFKLGNIAYKRNDRDLAAQLWRRALELNPGHELVRANLDTLSALA